MTINTQQRFTGHEENYDKIVDNFRESIDQIFKRENMVEMKTKNILTI
jgi:hypothetical protein